MNPDGALVIALDGSEHSAQTLDWGLAEAVLRRAPVVLARAFQEPREVMMWGWYPMLADLRLDTEASEYLNARADRARTMHPDLSISTRLLHGPAVPELMRLSKDAQLLVVGARGAAHRSTIGSVSAHLAAHAPCPVAVVRGLPHDATAPVLVGVDGSPTSIAAARAAAREALLRALPVVVVHARPTTGTPLGGEAVLPPLATSDETDPTRRAAEQVVSRLRADNAHLAVRLELLDDEPAHALTELSRDATLLVVGSRGLGAFRGMLLGSVSNEVVRGAAGTVLVVRAEPAD